MNARDVKTSDDARKIVEERDLNYVKVGAFDLDGVLRGKYISRDKFFSALDSGFGFCDVVLGWDMNDQTYDNVEFTGWHTGFPDAVVRVIPETCRDVPYEPGMLLFLGEFANSAESICPRAVLRRVIKRAEALGLFAFGAIEYEFFVFEETPHSVRDKGYANMKPMTPGSFGYSALRNSAGFEFHKALLDMGLQMDTPIEGLHTETGPGVLEAAITVDKVLNMADKAALFKTFAKVMAQRNGLMATFMAKWSPNEAGQSGHIHLSLKDGAGIPLFYDSSAPKNISKTMRHFVGGQQKLMPQILAMVAPTINSYSRLVPGYWAPTNATWGIDNRTTALRAITGSAKSQRVEYRVAGADGNPYLALAAALGSGIWGVENEIEPDLPLTGNAYEAEVLPERKLPATLWDAAQSLRASSAGRSLYGDSFVEHFAASREWEEREFRKHVTDWELQRYFEII